MSRVMDKDYYIGLDMGTDSVGWAVTDTDYNLLKARGRDMWGSYLFDPAETAAARRGFRTARRRTARTRQRLNLLQDLFAAEIEKIDPTFFIRLNNSSLFMEDKDERLDTANILFADNGYTDKDYFKAFPTIYHLRAYLLDGKVSDIRFLYLAVHHIIKNRGHFLFEGQNFDVGDTETVKTAFEKVNQIFSENDVPGELVLCDIDKALDVLKDKRIGKKDKVRQLKELLHVGKDKTLSAAINAITGCTASLKDLYDTEEDLGDANKFCFADGAFDENKLPAIEAAVGFDEAELVRQLKSIYDWSVLCEILGDEKYISKAKIQIYKRHAEDLLELKTYIRENCPEKYALTFRHNKENNYAAYIGMDKRKGHKKCNREEFYAFLKKTVGVSGDILEKIEAGEFMPKQVSNANGVIPYQVHLLELHQILLNAARYFPFLSERSDGFSVSEKIEMLMTFRIPYYVGPLNTDSGFAWVKKYAGQERVSVTPWNFDKVVDRDASEQGFIRRMTNKCTYLKGEDVLPESSFLYSEFVFLNELNNLKINGIKDPQAKALIYEYAKTHKKITLKKCHELLVNNGILRPDSKKDEIFSGLDGDFKKSLGSYVDFRNIIGDKADTHSEMCEEIILWITLTSDKNRLVKKIKQKYGNILTDEEIKRIKGLNYTKWGRLSKKLLTGIYGYADSDGAVLSIIESMRLTNENFMSLMSAGYGFRSAIDEYNAAAARSGNVTYGTVQELYCSPSVKRAIWRSIELVREIIKIFGRAPKKLFIEMAREVNDDTRKGRRTVSRKQQLIDLYKNLREESRDWIAEIENMPDMKFNSDRLILYYRQLGRSMYSGNSIRLEDVFNKNVCDIDHIYPQSKIKDDSLDNKVLVFKTENAAKTDVYPISADIRNRMRGFWTELKNKGLISERKYERLTRSVPLTTDELSDFISRQLVETRQSTKAAAQLLKQMLPDTEIVYAKAGNANDFKDENEIIKVRELNNLHHAKDAYINIVVGNVYNTKFGHDASVYFRSHNTESYNIKYLYTKDIPGAWRVADKDRIIKTVKKNTCRVVRFTSNGHGQLFNATIKTAGANDNLIPLKANGAISDTSKYGGYDSATTAYFMLVKSKGKKDKTLLSLEAVPVYADLQFAGNVDRKVAYCVEKLGLCAPEILIDNIKLNTLFCLDGSYAYIRGKTGNRIVFCNANELILDEQNAAYLKNISNYFRDKKKLNRSELPVGEKINAEDNLKLYDALIAKLSSKVYSGLGVSGQALMLSEKRCKFIELTLENQCKILWEILKLMQCNSSLSDFSLIGGVANGGRILVAKNIQDQTVKMIYQSPTGYYRRVIDFSEFL